MKVEIGFEETDEVETLCNVEYIEPRDGAVYVEFENPAESDDPYAVTEFETRDNESPHSCASRNAFALRFSEVLREYEAQTSLRCSTQFDSRGPYIESVQRDEHDWFGAEDQQS